MRRIHICEERGSGVDKVVYQTELYQLPALKWYPLIGQLSPFAKVQWSA